MHKVNQKKWKANQEQNTKEYLGRQRRYKENSFEVPTHWPTEAVIEEHSIKAISESKNKVTSELHSVHGSVAQYNNSFERVNSKAAWNLPQNVEVQPEWRDTFSVRDDDRFYDIMDEVAEKLNDDSLTYVCGSDAVLSAIMVMEKGLYSWDIVVQKEENMIFLDVRTETDQDGSSSLKQNMLDLQFVGETSTTEPPNGKMEEYDRELKKEVKIPGAHESNLAYPLMVEGAQIHHTMQQCMIDKNNVEDSENPHPLSETESEITPHHAYVYKVFRLG